MAEHTPIGKAEERMVCFHAPDALLVEWLMEARHADVQFVRFRDGSVHRVDPEEIVKRLLEDPEALISRYRRWDPAHDAWVFFGDADWACFGSVRDFPTHGDLMRKLWKEHEQPDFTYGTPPSFFHGDLKSGALILNTQEHGPVVSLWTKFSEVLLPWVKKFLRQKIGGGDFTLERNEFNSHIQFRPIISKEAA